MCICLISETEPKSSEFKLQPGNTILGGDLYDARKKDIQYTDELDCLFTTVCLNNETYDCSYAANENEREWIFDRVHRSGLSMSFFLLLLHAFRQILI